MCWRTNMNIMCWSLLWAFLANKNDLTLHPRLSQSQFMFCRTGSRCWPSYLVRWVMKCYPDLKPSMNSPASGRCPITTFYWWYAYHPQILVVGNWFTTNYGHLWPILIHQLTDIRDPHIGPFDGKGMGSGLSTHLQLSAASFRISSHVSLYVIQTTTNLDLRFGSMWSNQVTTITTIVNIYNRSI